MFLVLFSIPIDDIKAQNISNPIVNLKPKYEAISILERESATLAQQAKSNRTLLNKYEFYSSVVRSLNAGSTTEAAVSENLQYVAISIYGPQIVTPAAGGAQLRYQDIVTAPLLLEMLNLLK